ncbi:MAG: Cna B-type domain-containing protein, partial [Ruminococcus sp.]|nr:Cna B-type domain-containing protein [Ruminococcus sp.]
MKKSFRKRMLSGFTAALMGVSVILPSIATLPLSTGAAEASANIPTLPMGDSSPSQVEGSDITIYDKEYSNYGLFNTTMPLGLANNFHLFAFESLDIGAHCNGNFAAPKVNVPGNWGTSQLKGSGGDLTVITEEIVSMSPVTDTNILFVPEKYEVKVTSGNGETLVEKGNPINNGDMVYINDHKITFNATPSYIYKVSEDFIDFAKEQQSYISFANELRDPAVWNIKNPIGKDNMLKGASQLTGSYNLNNEYVIAITDEQKEGPCVLNINVKDIVEGNGPFNGFVIDNIGDEPLVINMDLAGYGSEYSQSFSMKFKKNGEDLNNLEESIYGGTSILWNYYDSSNETDGTFSGNILLQNTVIGSVLAPKALVSAGSNVDGTIIANVIKTSAETHRSDFLSPSGLTVQKTWSDGNNQHLTGSVEVQLYSANVPDADIFKFDDEEYAASIGLQKYGEPVKLSSENGWRHNWGNLLNASSEDEGREPFFYYAKEVSLDGYAISSYVNGNGVKGTGVITLSNTPLNYSVKINKVNEINEPVEGALFGLYDGDTLVKKWTSGATATDIKIPSAINISELSEKNEFTSTYTIKEIMAPEGYITDTSSQKITLKETVEVTEADGQPFVTKINATMEYTIGSGYYAQKNTYNYEITENYTDGFISSRDIAVTRDVWTGGGGYVPPTTVTDAFTVDFVNGIVTAGETQISSVDTDAEYVIPSGAPYMPDTVYHYDSSSYMVTSDTNSLTFTNKVAPLLQKVDDSGNVLAGAKLKLEEGTLSPGEEGFTFTVNAEAEAIQWESGYDEALSFSTISTEDFVDGTYNHVYRISETEAPAGYDKAEDIYLVKQESYSNYGRSINVYYITAENGKVTTFPLELGYWYNMPIVNESDEEHGWSKMDILNSELSDRIIKMTDKKIKGIEINFNKVEVLKTENGDISFTDKAITGAEVDLYADDGSEEGVLIAKNIFGKNSSEIKLSEIKTGPAEKENFEKYVQKGRLLPGKYFLVEKKAPEGVTPFEGKQYFTVTDDSKAITGVSSQVSVGSFASGKQLVVGNAGRKVVAISYVKKSGNQGKINDSNGTTIAELNFNDDSGKMDLPTDRVFTIPEDGIIVFDKERAIEFESLTLHFEIDSNIKSDYLNIISPNMGQYNIYVGNYKGGVLETPKYEVVINKKDAAGENGNEVAGATLKLTGTDVSGNAITFAEGSLVLGNDAEAISASGDNLSWKSGNTPTNVTVPNGTYTLHEEAAPNGYKIASDITFKVTDGKITLIGENGEEEEVGSITMVDELIPEPTPTYEVVINKKDAAGENGNEVVG